jgi:amidohydrolase
MTKPNIEPEILREKDFLINLRRHFHKYPELGFQEFKTSETIAKNLKEFGLDVKTSVAKTGVIGLLKGKNPGKTILIRADMDALPIQEGNKIIYASCNSAIMHACGHDAHSAIAVTTAKILSKLKDKLHGNVKFIFQPDEEGSGGALPLIKEGVLDNPKVDYAFGLHVSNKIEYPKVSVSEGIWMANSDRFDVEIIGKGCHAASPHLGIDPINVACHIIIGLNTLVAKAHDPLAPCVISVCKINAGTATNIIPEKASFSGTIRTLNNNLRKDLRKKVLDMISNIAKSFNAKYLIKMTEGYSSVNNDKKVSGIVREIAKETVGESNLILDKKSLGVEDMSYFLQKVPGCFFEIGTANKKKGILFPAHQPTFNIDEDALIIGVSVFYKIIMKLIGTS